MKSIVTPAVYVDANSVANSVQMTGTLSAALAAKTLRQTVCRLDAMVGAAQLPPLPDRVVAPAQRLVDLVMTLRSPTGGWPPNLEQTPENLEPYIGDETAELLDALAQVHLPAPVVGATATPVVTVADLVPHLLWLIASSGYEVMQLVEGLRARLYVSADQFSLQVVRLVPVLTLTTGESQTSLDLVTQTDPQPQPALAPTMELQLIDHDLDMERFQVNYLLGRVHQQIHQTTPILQSLLTQGWAVDCLRPGQGWQPGQLRLQLYLTDIGPRRSDSTASPSSPGDSSLSAGTAGLPTESFTIDDFADALAPRHALQTAGIMGDWLTFTNDDWIQAFLQNNAQRTLAPALLVLLQQLQQQTVPTGENLACIRAVYDAVTSVVGQGGLFSHTFVHRSLLFADVWPRLRWYLAQSSERVMQLMGGIPARALQPGLFWQSGNLFLRPLLTLQVGGQLWLIDLGSGRLLPALPFALVADAIVDLDERRFWPSPLTVHQLMTAITADFEQGAPALAQLRQGTDINLHQVETGDGCQSGTLSLDWIVTLQSAT